MPDFESFYGDHKNRYHKISVSSMSVKHKPSTYSNANLDPDVQQNDKSDYIYFRIILLAFRFLHILQEFNKKKLFSNLRFEHMQAIYDQAYFF